MTEYRISITSSAKRAAKKLPDRVRSEAVNKSLFLRNNPYLGEKLTGSIHFLHSLHFKSKNVQYRIAYTINSKEKLVIVHLVGPRENFYKKLRRLFK